MTPPSDRTASRPPTNASSSAAGRIILRWERRSEAPAFVGLFRSGALRRLNEGGARSPLDPPTDQIGGPSLFPWTAAPVLRACLDFFGGAAGRLHCA